MPAPYGVTPEGFSRPSVQELIAQCETDQLSEISPTLDVSSDSVLGQLNGIYMRHLGMAWEALETAYHGYDPDRAEDALLTALAKLTGTDRRGATPSTVPVVVNLNAGTTLIAGTHFAHVTGEPDRRFTPVATFTAPSTGNFNLVFRSEELGPVHAPLNTLSVIATPVVGWNSISNPLVGATLGEFIEEDPDLRVRREAQLAASGSSTIDALRADLLEIDEVQSVLMFENTSHLTDDAGRPPHSFEAVIWDDDPPEADPNVIAQVVWDGKPAGIHSYGAVSGTATDALGEERIMSFSRALARVVWLTFDVVPREGYVGDAAFATQIAIRCNELFGVGDDVTFYDVMLQSQGLGAQVTALRLGFASPPTASLDLPIGIREIARFDTARITVNS